MLLSIEKQAHLKLYKLQNKQCEAVYSIMKKYDMWTVNPINKVNTGDNIVQSRPKMDIKPPVKLNL